MSYVDEAFSKLKSTLETTDTENELASSRQNLIRDHLTTNWDIKETFLEGSYKRHTKTKRLQDVDIFVVIDADGDQGHFKGEPPGRVLDALAKVLKERWDDVTIDRMAAVVSHGDDVASFEVVPAFRRDGEGFRIPDRKLGKWIDTDPSVHEDLSTRKNKACGEKYVPFVKMVKGANRELGNPVAPSFLLEVMALDLVAEPFGRYQDEVSWFLASAADQVTNDWPDPAGLGPDVNSEMDVHDRKSAADALAGAAEIAQRAVWLEDDGQERAAVDEWRRLFGWRMPRP